MFVVRLSKPLNEEWYKAEIKRLVRRQVARGLTETMLGSLEKLSLQRLCLSTHSRPTPVFIWVIFIREMRRSIEGLGKALFCPRSCSRSYNGGKNRLTMGNIFSTYPGTTMNSRSFWSCWPETWAGKSLTYFTQRKTAHLGSEEPRVLISLGSTFNSMALLRQS